MSKSTLDLSMPEQQRTGQFYRDQFKALKVPEIVEDLECASTPSERQSMLKFFNLLSTVEREKGTIVFSFAGKVAMVAPNSLPLSDERELLEAKLEAALQGESSPKREFDVIEWGSDGEVISGFEVLMDIVISGKGRPVEFINPPPEIAEAFGLTAPDN